MFSPCFEQETAFSLFFSRNGFVSRFDDGVLIEMDYDAYHLRLIADIIGYDFPDGSVHEYLGKQYGVD